MRGFLDSVRGSLPLTPRAEWLIFALLCTVLLGQLLFSVNQLSLTADEATHLYAGYRYEKCGDLTVSPEHPPLAKIVAAAPLLAMNLEVDCSPFHGEEIKQALTAQSWLASQNWALALTRARMAISVFGLGLCLLVWIAARRMFDFATAVVATVLLIFEPNILAYSPLVMTDIPVTCMFLFAVFAFYLWIKNRTFPFLLLTAVATGLSLLAKNSGVALIPILGALAVADALLYRADQSSNWRAMLRNFLAVALICAISFGIVWAGYGMRFAASPEGVQFQSAPEGVTVPRVVFAIKKYHILPEAYLQGFAVALSISDHSGPAFLAGKVYPEAPWFSVPFYILIRNTSAMLALFLIAILGVFIAGNKNASTESQQSREPALSALNAHALRAGSHRREFLFLVIPAAIFLAVCLRSSMIGGIRYLLPAFPFLLIAVAARCVQISRRIRWISYAIPCVLLLHAVSSLHAYPNYLSYANEFWGGPHNAHKYLPWLDTGQAYPEAKAYLEQHPSSNCWFITGWQWDPKFYGVPCQTFGIFLPAQIPPRVHGTVIVSNTLLTDVRLPEDELASPFKGLVPKDTIGGSALLVFEGEFDTRLLAAKSERDLMARAASAGQPNEALQHAMRAIELAPNSPLSHSFLCGLFSQTGQLDSAFNECRMARNLLQQDPLKNEPGRIQSLKQLDVFLSSAQIATKK